MLVSSWIFSIIFLWGQTSDELFESGNQHYQNGKYTQAISEYEKIEQSGVQSAELFYNLGNAYYKSNKIAPSIYYYERALMIDPKNEDVQNNLVLARRMVIDVIEPLPQTLMQRINEAVIYPISYNAWAWIAVILAFLSSATFILYYFKNYTHSKKRYFTLSLVFLGLFFVILSMGIKARYHYKNDQPAIVYTPEVSVKSEPIDDADEAFILHEGTKVQVVDSENEWCKIKIADGKTGWLAQNNIRKLK